MHTHLLFLVSVLLLAEQKVLKDMNSHAAIYRWKKCKDTVAHIETKDFFFLTVVGNVPVLSVQFAPLFLVIFNRLLFHFSVCIYVVSTIDRSCFFLAIKLCNKDC